MLNIQPEPCRRRGNTNVPGTAFFSGQTAHTNPKSWKKMVLQHNEITASSMIESNDYLTLYDNSGISVDPLPFVANEGRSSRVDTECVSLTDPFAPIVDMDSIFDEKETYAKPTQPRALQEMMFGSFLDFDSLENNICGQAPSSDNRGPKAIASDIVSEVLHDIEDITPIPFPPVVGSVDMISSVMPQASQISEIYEKLYSQASQSKRELQRESATVSPASKRRKTHHDSSDSEDSNNACVLREDAAGGRFRVYQAEQWMVKFAELVEYKNMHGHCQVPHGYKEKPTLARWAKRQRYQYKLFNEKKSSTMTQIRIDALEELGFVWDSHSALWEERYKELRQYVFAFGHANVPSNFPPNNKLAIWVKCQRRQSKLLCAGGSSNMKLERIDRLNKLNFIWEIRKTGLK